MRHSLNRTFRPLAGLVAAGLLLGATTTLMLRTAADWASPQSAYAEAEKSADAKAKPAAKTAEAKPAVTPKAVAKKPAAKAPAKKSKAKPATTQALTQVDDQVSYQYNALGRRDPFQSLVEGAYVGADVGGDAPPDIGGIQVVGIVWGARDKFALVDRGRCVKGSNRGDVADHDGRGVSISFRAVINLHFYRARVIIVPRMGHGCSCKPRGLVSAVVIEIPPVFQGITIGIVRTGCGQGLSDPF